MGFTNEEQPRMQTRFGLKICMKLKKCGGSVPVN